MNLIKPIVACTNLSYTGNWYSHEGEMVAKYFFVALLMYSVCSFANNENNASNRAFARKTFNELYNASDGVWGVPYASILTRASHDWKVCGNDSKTVLMLMRARAQKMLQFHKQREASLYDFTDFDKAGLWFILGSTLVAATCIIHKLYWGEVNSIKKYIESRGITVVDETAARGSSRYQGVSVTGGVQSQEEHDLIIRLANRLGVLYRNYYEKGTGYRSLLLLSWCASTCSYLASLGFIERGKNPKHKFNAQKCEQIYQHITKFSEREFEIQPTGKT